MLCLKIILCLLYPTLLKKKRFGGIINFVNILDTYFKKINFWVNFHKIKKCMQNLTPSTYLQQIITVKVL